MGLGFVCPTCGCSLIRLGIDVSKAPKEEFKGRVYHFCCKGCRDMFLADPEKFAKEVEDIFVCPVCLGEKHKGEGVKEEFGDRVLWFCRCPYCLREFKENPDYYLRRLEGKEPFEGMFSCESGCC